MAENNKKYSTSSMLALNDSLHAICTKWKFPIIGSLFDGRKRFNEIERLVPGITPRMLSRELKDLEVNGIVTRTVLDTAPVSVVYALTKSGESFQQVLDVMIEWGAQHRQNIIGERVNRTSVV